MITGLLLIVAALILTGYNIWKSKKADDYSSTALEEIVTHIDEVNEQKETAQELGVPDYVTFPEKEMPVVSVEEEYYVGVLEIPDLGLTLPVLGGEWHLSKLEKAPCCYAGSVYTNNMVIAAHNYQSHFGRIKNLNAGSRICFIDTEGNVFNYFVGWIDVLQPTDGGLLIENTDWDLTLFTCTYDGSERYAVRCIREK